jgi:hypothetical protein
MSAKATGTADQGAKRKRKITQDEVIRKLSEVIKEKANAAPGQNTEEASCFIATRLESQLIWYKRRAENSKKCYYAFACVAFSLPLVTAILNVIELATTPNKVILFPLADVILSGIVSTCGYLLGKFRFQEHWANYRTALEHILHHANLFCAKAEPYENDDSLQFFVKNVEEIIGSEMDRWEASNND